MMRRSIALRYAVTAFAGTAVILAGLGLYLLRSVEAHFAEMDHAELVGSLDHLAYMGRADGTRNMTTLLAQIRSMGMGHGPLLARFETADGQVLADTLGFTPPRPDSNHQTLLTTQAKGHHYRLLAAPFDAGDGQTLRAWVAMDIGHHQAFMALFRNALWTAIGIALIVSLALSVLAARWGLAPLGHLRALLGEVSGARLSMRLQVEELPRELAGLAAEFNQMLARLDDSFRRLSQFSSDIAHELRTPVSNLLIETEVALSQDRPLVEYQDVLHANLEELQRLSTMIADMLFLARADNRLVTPKREAIDLAQTLHELCEWFEASAEEHQIRLAASGSGTIQGDRLMLRRALSNLIANAIRHALPGTTIEIRITPDEAGGQQLCVANQGETIAPEHLPHLFDRFYQADASRTHKGDGAGLGLAITRSIVEAHGGEIGVTSDNGHTTFRMRFA